MSDIGKIATEQARQGEQIEAIQKTCTKIEQCLLGNGKPGLVVRTDRLEQKDKFKSKWFWVIAIAITALFIKTVGIDLIATITKATN